MRDYKPRSKLVLNEATDESTRVIDEAGPLSSVDETTTSGQSLPSQSSRMPRCSRRIASQPNHYLGLTEIQTAVVRTPQTLLLHKTQTPHKHCARLRASFVMPLCRRRRFTNFLRRRFTHRYRTWLRPIPLHHRRSRIGPNSAPPSMTEDNWLLMHLYYIDNLEVQKLPCFEEKVPEYIFMKWKFCYELYIKDMVDAMQLDLDAKNIAAEATIKKYKEILYDAEELKGSPRSNEDVYQEALAIFQVTYDHAMSHNWKHKENQTRPYGLHASFLPLVGLPLAVPLPEKLKKRKGSSSSVERTHQSRDPEGCTYKSSDPEGYTYQSSDLEGCTYQSSDPEGCTYQLVILKDARISPVIP
ncbi:putative RNA-dependent RNA polymerase 5 isoform X1 [Cucumis melo var. makuwa]|uniref:Putative RNA-dependent RNA polymerase 5 isoform X1 n=1 Tax=Cucumis melo var. makuwa TaxID=1194695 RepID=A0A5D3DZ18_CUCMM|nr:putative RNA-dependent RNA polymerase 5 isoform X1 [Cucumis melo var. makuwa]